jgi:hypothetical protein
VSIYSTGAEAFRDTTKWLVAFVPIASIVTAGVVVGPRLISDAARSDAGDNVWPLVGMAAVAMGVVLVVWFGAKVLSTQPKDFTQLFTEDRAKMSTAFSAGVGAPYFLSARAYIDAIGDLNAKRSAHENVTDAELASVETATDKLQAWALHNALSSSFNRFLISFGVGLPVIATGFVVTIAALGPQSGNIDEPTVVEVTVEEAGAKGPLALDPLL